MNNVPVPWSPPFYESRRAVKPERGDFSGLFLLPTQGRIRLGYFTEHASAGRAAKCPRFGRN